MKIFKCPLFKHFTFICVLKVFSQPSRFTINSLFYDKNYSPFVVKYLRTKFKFLHVLILVKYNNDNFNKTLILRV